MFSSLKLLSALSFAITASTQATFGNSPKRGLVFTPNIDYPEDDQIWVKSNSDITWYYNYGSQPSPQFANIPQSKFEFVPMIWGAPASTSDNEFLYNVTQLVNGGRNITHVLAFNEPDGSWQQGGSNINATLAAQSWIREIVPLQKMGIKVGAPAMEFPGLSWLKNFTEACQNCTFDFIPLHFYGNSHGLEWHAGEIHAAFPNTKLWITEFADNDALLNDTQSSFNLSTNFLDNTDYIERYSYFGAFRSSKSNVGPNATFLTSSGKLTDIGSWYLGGAATGNIPTVATSKASKIHGGELNIAFWSTLAMVVAWIAATELDF